MNDLETAYEILEDMHQLILAREIFPEALKEEAVIAIEVLKEIKVKDYDHKRAIDDTIELLNMQLKINAENEERRAKLWERVTGKGNEGING